MKKLLLVVGLLLVPQVVFAQAYVRGIRVTVPPPAMRFEVRPPAPSQRHMWIPGYWTPNGAQHAWVGGHWAVPPGPGYVWEPARWDNTDGAYMFYEGHWRASEEADPNVAYQPPPPPVNEVTVQVAPPAPLEEVRPPSPFANAVWVGGYWHWNGFRQVWVAGRWSPRPAGFEWEGGRWDKRGDGRFSFHPGHWHHR